MEGFNEDEFNKNIDLLKQIAEKSKAQVGNWKTPLKLYAWGTTKGGEPRSYEQMVRARERRRRGRRADPGGNYGRGGRRNSNRGVS